MACHICHMYVSFEFLILLYSGARLSDLTNSRVWVLLTSTQAHIHTQLPAKNDKLLTVTFRVTYFIYCSHLVELFSICMHFKSKIASSATTATQIECQLYRTYTLKTEQINGNDKKLGFTTVAILSHRITNILYCVSFLRSMVYNRISWFKALAKAQVIIYVYNF